MERVCIFLTQSCSQYSVAHPPPPRHPSISERKKREGEEGKRKNQYFRDGDQNYNVQKKDSLF